MTIPAASKQWIERCEVPASSEPERSCFEAFQGEFDYLCRTLRRLGVRTEDIEDDAHEVFLVLNRKWSDYDPSRQVAASLTGRQVNTSV